MNAYWAQWDYEENGIEEEIDTDLYLIESDTDLCHEYQCCGGRGCNYCLMVS